MTDLSTFIDNTVADVTRLTKSPGICLAIDGPEEAYSKSFGVTNINAPTPITHDCHFRIGSVTKLMTALAVLGQVHSGSIKLSDSLEQYIPGVDRGSEITIKHLLTHTSGVYEYNADWLINTQMTYLSNWSTFGLDAPLNLIRQGKARFVPGTATAYSNSGYWLLGKILQSVTQRPVGQILIENVAQPLGMLETSYPIDSSIPEPAVHGYTQFWFMTFDTTPLNPNYVGATGAIISTMNDLGKLAEALCTGVQLPLGVKELWDQVFVAPPSTTPQWQGLTGSISGYSTICYWEPTSKTTFVGMENLPLSPTSGLQRIFDRINLQILNGA